MAVTLPASLLRRYSRFTLYNSPFVAHDHGRAVDLYPGDPTHPDPEPGAPVDAPSPVAGEVVAVRTVRAPPKPYAADEDHLIVIDTGATVDAPDGFETPAGDAPLARILHVDPAVEPGDYVAAGDSLGRLVRAGFFAPWVANHLHLGFRERGANADRAGGSLPLALDPSLRLESVAWHGRGTVVAAGDTYAVLDRPAHPAPGAAFAGLAATDASGAVAGVLDGGLPHYEGGGLLQTAGDARDGGNDGDAPDDTYEGPIHLLDAPVGTVDGRDVGWDEVTVLANGEPVGGIALSAARDGLGVKLVGDAVDLPVGTDVRVALDHSP